MGNKVTHSFEVLHKILCILLTGVLLLQIGCTTTKVLQTVEPEKQKTDERKYLALKLGQVIRITYKRSGKSAKRLDVVVRVKYVTSDAVVVDHQRAEFQVPFDIIEKIELVDEAKILTPHELRTLEQDDLKAEKDKQVPLKSGQLIRVTIKGLYKGLYKRSKPLVAHVKSVTSDAIVVTNENKDTRIYFEHIKKIEVVTKEFSTLKSFIFATAIKALVFSIAALIAYGQATSE